MPSSRSGRRLPPRLSTVLRCGLRETSSMPWRWAPCFDMSSATSMKSAGVTGRSPRSTRRPARLHQCRTGLRLRTRPGCRRFQSHTGRGRWVVHREWWFQKASIRVPPSLRCMRLSRGAVEGPVLLPDRGVPRPCLGRLRHRRQAHSAFLEGDSGRSLGLLPFAAIHRVRPTGWSELVGLGGLDALVAEGSRPCSFGRVFQALGSSDCWV